MLMREKKIIENLITKEELLLFLTKENHTLHLLHNMVLLIHSEKRTELKDTLHRSQNGLMMHHSLVHSGSVTYLNMDTIKQLEQILTISKIQLKIL